MDLFPRKFHKGFSSHRFAVAAIDQPPFVIKISSTDAVGNVKLDWDGYEVRLLQMMSERLNFSCQFIEPSDIGRENELGYKINKFAFNCNNKLYDEFFIDFIIFRFYRRTYSVIDMVEDKDADIGVAGAFVSIERMLRIEMSHPHSADCAAFITLSSKALPRYRAILGPFQWPVWLAIIAAYVFAIFPLTFSDRLTLRHLIGNWGEIENMFWYVFGTFTNSLTFTGEFSWSSSKKTSTRILIGNILT